PFQSLLIDDRPVAPANDIPATVDSAPLLVFKAAERVFGGCLFIDFNAPSGSFVSIKVAVLHDRAAFEHFLHAIIEGGVLLNAEVRRCDVERHVGGVTDG